MRIILILILFFFGIYQYSTKETIERQNEMLRSRIERLETQLDLKSIEMTIVKQNQSKDILSYNP